MRQKTRTNNKTSVQEGTKITNHNETQTNTNKHTADKQTTQRNEVPE